MFDFLNEPVFCLRLIGLVYDVFNTRPDLVTYSIIHCLGWSD